MKIFGCQSLMNKKKEYGQTTTQAKGWYTKVILKRASQMEEKLKIVFLSYHLENGLTRVVIILVLVLVLGASVITTPQASFG